MCQAFARINLSSVQDTLALRSVWHKGGGEFMEAADFGVDDLSDLTGITIDTILQTLGISSK